MPKRSSDPFGERFKVVSEECKPRIIGSSYGEVGTLKTSFWLGAPGPIFVQSTDQGLEGVAEPFVKAGKVIYSEDYDPNTTDLDQAGAEEIAQKIEEDFEFAIENGVKTILWDKETQIYEIFKYAVLGAPSDAPSNYYPLYQRMDRMYSKAKASDINFGVIQGMKTPWVPKVSKSSGKTGAAPSLTDRVRRGMVGVEERVHINIEHFLDAETNKFMMKIGKSRGPGGQAIQNQTIEFTPFAELAVAIFPETTEEDWQ